MKKKVVVINIGWEQEPLIENLVRRNYLIYGIHSNNNYRNENYFEKVFISDFRDLERILQIVDLISPDAVISDQCDYSNFAQAVICEKLGLFGPSIENAQISCNKWLQRELAKKSGIKIPNFRLVTNLREAEEAALEIGYPVIIKPIDNRGSFGVCKVNNKIDLLNSFNKALIFSHSRFLLIEQFIDGFEITVDGYCISGVPKSLAVALKSKEGLESQVSMDIKYPADISEDLMLCALNNNEFVARSFKYKFGMIHSEYLIDKKGDIFLIESANRGGGVFTSEVIVPQVSGINLLDLYINDCCGIETNFNSNFKVERNQVILKFFSFEPGTVRRIEGFDNVCRESGVLKCKLNFAEGDTIGSIENDSSRHGFIIYSSEGDVRKEVMEILQMIRVFY